MHRFSWDLHYAPIPGVEPAGNDAMGAVPHRTYPSVAAPWAPPGTYTVRLTVGSKTFTQPLVLHLDPRVKTPAAGLAQLATLSRSTYDTARAAHAAYRQARALIARLDSLPGAKDNADIAAFRAKVDSVSPVPAPRRGFGAPAPTGPPTLSGAASAMMTAVMAMQGADVAPTAKEIAACDRGVEQYHVASQHWTALKTTGLAALNAKLRGAGQPEVKLPAVPAEEAENARPRRLTDAGGRGLAHAIVSTRYPLLAVVFAVLYFSLYSTSTFYFLLSTFCFRLFATRYPLRAIARPQPYAASGTCREIRLWRLCP